MKKRYKISLIVIILIVVGVIYAANHILPYAIIQPTRTHIPNPLDENDFPYQNIEVFSLDSLKLKGYHVKSSIDTTRASIILVHGIGGCKEHFSELAMHLSHLGFDTWFFDNRAHGESEGKYSTYGFHERKDISKIIDRVKIESPNNKIGIWGNSLGGAIAIQALEYDKRIDFGLIESTFSDLHQIVYDYQKRFSFGIGLKFLDDMALNKAGKIAQFNPDEVSPIKSATKIHQPILIAHGDADENINVDYGKDLYEALLSEDKELIIVKGGGHYGLFETGGENYKNQLFTFLSNNSKN